MPTITKRDLVCTIADCTKCPRDTVKLVMQATLDAIVETLGKGHRIEFRDFGVFESKQRGARKSQNPRTKTVQEVGPRRTVRFKAGRLMKAAVMNPTADLHTLTKRKVQPRSKLSGKANEGAVELKLTSRGGSRRRVTAANGTLGKPSEPVLKLSTGG